MYGLPPPAFYVKYTPTLFESWCEWADAQTKKESKRSQVIKPLGESEGPDWMKTVFQHFEDFFTYYCELIGMESA